MKKILITVIAIYCSLNMSFAQVKAEKDFGIFTKLNASGDVRIRLYSAEKEKIVIEAPSKDYVEALDIKNENGELWITTTKGIFNDAKNVKINIYYKKLSEIQAYGSAAISCENALLGTKLLLNASSGGQILAEIKVNTLEASVGQGSVITLEGTAETQKIKATSGGTFSAFSLLSKNAYLEALTGGKVKANVSELLDANASMGGYIGYVGKPAKIKTKTSFKGTIEEAMEPTDD